VLFRSLQAAADRSFSQTLSQPTGNKAATTSAMNGDDEGGGSHRKGKECPPIKPQSDASLSTASTAQTGAMTPMSHLTCTPQTPRRRTRHHAPTTNEGVLLLRRTTMCYSAASVCFLILFLVAYLPLAAILFLLAFVASAMLSSYSLFQYLVAEVNRTVQGRGFGHFISDSMYNQLTELTLHEWMQDSSFTREYRHLMLYFVPGITPEQLDMYIDRLPPRHRDNLRRHGLGHLVGESFMRFLMGDERYRFHLEHNSAIRPSELVLLPPPPTTSNNSTLSISRLLFVEDSEDEHSDLGLQLTSEDMVDESIMVSSILQQTPGESPITMAPSPFVTSPLSDDVQLLQEQEQEAIILADAFYSMSQTYLRQTMSSMTVASVSFIEYISPIVIGSGLTVTVFSAATTAAVAGIGLFGGWFGNGPSSQRTGLVVGSSTMMFGGASVSLMYLVRSAVRSCANTSNKSIKKKEE